MRLSANNLKNTEKQKVAFEGVKQEYNKNNEPVYKFIAPSCNPDEQVVLEVILVDIDEKTHNFEPIISGSPRKLYAFDKDIIEIKQSELRKEHPAFAYRYVIIDKKTQEIRRVLDEYQTIEFSDNDAKLNVISHGKHTSITPKMGTMVDVFKDTGAILSKNKDGLEADRRFYRDHFRKLGGSIEGLNWLLKNTNVLYPYRYIKTTPDVCVDKTSSHGYWPNNIYQSPDKDALSDFIFELYKRGKGYIADGAYTSQSVQSPIVQHVLKYGKDSPFYNMLKINGDIKLGILPLESVDKNDNNISHIGVRIVNPKGEGYNKNKPTYIQFYDDRLSSMEQRKDSSKLIEKYDLQPEDHYEITQITDSVQPFYFEINPNDSVYDSKIKVFEKLGKNVLLKDITEEKAGVSRNEFLRFPHFEIATYNKSSGVVNWDGNTEIIKMNLTNPINTKENREGMMAARKYVEGAVAYWTESTQSDLILKTAKIKNKESLRQIAYANDISKDDFEYIINSENIDKINSIVLAPVKNKNGDVISKMGKTVEMYVREFPLQSIETSMELSAIFAQPQFKKEFLDNSTIQEIINIVSSAIDSAIPKEFAENKEYKAYVTKLYAPKIIKNLIIGAMNPDAINKDGSIDIKKLNDITLKSIVNKEVSSVESERRAVVKRIQNGISEKNIASIKTSIKNELENISLNDFKMAEAIVLKGKGGLNWRFDAAKDIADLDSVRDKTSTFEKVWYGDGKNPGAYDFWVDITGQIRKYNPASYVINEITSLWEFYNWQDENRGENFSSKLSKVNKYVDKLPDYAEIEFLQQSNSTTSSNYGYFFNKLSNFIGCDPEFGNPDNYNNLGNIGMLKRALESFNSINQPNAAMMSHVFWENYDKPRVLHMLALGENQTLFYTDGVTRESLSQAVKGDRGDEFKAKIAKVADDNTNYNKMSSKGIAVGLTLINAVEASNVVPKDKKEDVIKQIKLYALGKKHENSSLNIKRAERFGAMPYELSMVDVFKGAGYKESDAINLTDEFCLEFLKEPMKKEERLWQTVCAMGGTPTVYLGMEYGQTGYETAAKNVFQANRNLVLHNRKGFGKYADKLNAISSLYLEKQMSAIRDGFVVSLDTEDIGDYTFWPIYKYDDKGSKVISVVTNCGIKNKKFGAVNAIKVEGKDARSPLPYGTKLKRKVYDASLKKYVDETDKQGNPIIYVINKYNKIVKYVTDKNGNMLENPASKDENNRINIDDSTMTFYVPETKMSIDEMLDYRKYFYSMRTSSDKLGTPKA